MLSDKRIEKIQKITGTQNTFLNEETLKEYSADETPDLSYRPDIVVKVENIKQIKELLRYSNSEKIPIVPRGAGTGTTGGCLAVCGGVVLLLEGLNKIVDVDEKNLMAVVQPGVITGNLQSEVEAKGLFYPVDPASLDSCSIGGNVAENSGGPRAVKYGVTKNYVCGLKAVLPDGSNFIYGGKIVKNVMGYDLPGIMIGSEGTLAVFTEITLKLLPYPAAVTDLLIPFKTIKNAAVTVSAILLNKIIPAAIEFMDKNCIKAVESLLERKLPHSDAEAHLLIQLDGMDQKETEKLYEHVGKICLNNGAEDVFVAENRPMKERLWEARRKIREAIKPLSPVKRSSDVVVPRFKIPELLDGIYSLQEKHEVRIFNFGHAGDGNVHVNILKENMDNGMWQKKLPVILDDLYNLVIGLGGAISGEHGIGIIQKKYLKRAVGRKELQVMRAIKKLFDPSNILNPGKIFG